MSDVLKVGGVIEVEGSITVVDSGDGSNGELGHEIGLNLISTSGTQVTLVILDLNAGTAATGLVLVGPFDVGVVEAESTSTNGDLLGVSLF